MQLFSVEFFMPSVKIRADCEKYLLINIQIYAPNICAGQKHHEGWRLISRQMFAILCPLINGQKQELNVRSVGSY